MQLKICFVGKAEVLAGLYDTGDGPGFILNDHTSGASALTLPNIGDKLLLRAKVGPAIRHFRCMGRTFDFSIPSEPTLEVYLDLA
ncbi:MAG: hypothetical protein J0M00_03585 [Burkholderiales bacterium]|nr:hypothetical protein [Burkholderiales bacterium]